MHHLREDIIYLYDGTLDGVLTCIFESFARREMPSVILPPEQRQCSLFETRVVATDCEKADRVIRGLIRTAGEEAAEITQLAHLTALPGKELAALRYVRLAMKSGPAVCSMLADPCVNLLNRAIRHLYIEAHHLCGFIRFTEADHTLLSIINPRNDVLPLLDDHFSDRLPEERFIIYDRGRQRALMHLPGESRIMPVGKLHMPHISAEEMDVQMLWKRFYHTIAIQGRINPKLERSLLPLRFRQDMTEFQTPSTSKGALIP